MKNEKITERTVDFAKWYTDIIDAARLAGYSKVKGCVILEPNGYAIWESMQSALDKMFKETGHQNVCMPLFIPESLLKKESDHVEGFAPEVAWVTHGGKNELEEKVCVRPTSETLFSDYYSEIIRSYRDLPKLLNQWCNVVRWEKETRPFLRGREFLWQEGHTVHSTKEEAEEETLRMINVYKTFYEEYLAIPVFYGRKTEKEKFAGAEYTYTIEALMYNGIFLQSGTSHYFGQKFSIPFNIKFLNKDNKEEYAYQTSWGLSTRSIGALIMVHSDDKGLVLPPRIAPRKVVLIPIGKDQEVINKCNELKEMLLKDNISTFIDETDKSPGFKYAEHEVNGIPLRIAIGKRDLESNKFELVLRNGEKNIIGFDDDIVKIISELLEKFQKYLYNTALKRRDEKTYECSNLDEIKTIIQTNPGVVKAHWCGDEKCELKMKELNGTKSRCIIESKDYKDKNCVVCNKKAKHNVIWGIQY